MAVCAAVFVLRIQKVKWTLQSAHLRFEGLILTLRNIYLHFEGLMPK